jgi:hypothetical protein
MKEDQEDRAKPSVNERDQEREKEGRKDSLE